MHSLESSVNGRHACTRLHMQWFSIISLAFKAIQDLTPDYHLTSHFLTLSGPLMPPTLCSFMNTLLVLISLVSALPLFAMSLLCCSICCTPTSRFSSSTILFLCHLPVGYLDAWTPLYSHSTLSSFQLQFLLQSILSLFYCSGSMIKWKEPKNKMPYLGFKSCSIWHYPLNVAIC